MYANASPLTGIETCTHEVTIVFMLKTIWHRNFTIFEKSVVFSDREYVQCFVILNKRPESQMESWERRHRLHTQRRRQPCTSTVMIVATSKSQVRKGLTDLKTAKPCASVGLSFSDTQRSFVTTNNMAFFLLSLSRVERMSKLYPVILDFIYGGRHPLLRSLELQHPKPKALKGTP
jgi:hypothetical protein